MGEPKIIVAIPTRGRPPAVLRATLHSVAEQATRFKHDVEIVVSNWSDEEHATANGNMIEKLRDKFPKVAIHHYPLSKKLPLQQALESASQAERTAFESLVPKDGLWGANRNRLALLAVYHGRKNSAYLHLDDDTPLLVLEDEPRAKTIKKQKSDAIGLFLKSLKDANKSGRAGHAAIVKGVGGGTKPLGEGKHPTLREELLSYTHTFWGDYGGPARILNYEAMKTPYSPYRGGEVLTHSEDIGGSSISERKKTSKAVPQVLHIGRQGYSPKRIDKETSTLEFKEGWASLVKRMNELGKQARKTKQ